MNLDNYDWYCDSCNECLNNQLGFSFDCGFWTCTSCGYSNYIDASEVLSQSEADDFLSSGFDSYDEYRNKGEGISVSEAALIWKSHGKDSDYMFGYTEDELNNN